MSSLLFLRSLREIKTKTEKQRNRETERERERERRREITNKTNRKEVWLDFHIRHRDENTAKGLPSFSKN